MTIRHLTAIVSGALLTLSIGCNPIPDKDRGMEGNDVNAVEVDGVAPAESTGTMTPKRDATANEKLKSSNGSKGMPVVVEEEVK